jgi:hypothetical protein
MMERAFDARKNGAYTLTWKNGAVENLALEALTARLFQYVRELMLGANANPGARAANPFTIATVTRGDGVDENASLAPEGEIHRVLHGLCRWSETWQNDAGLDSPEKANLLKGAHPNGHLLYASKNGRAVWFPEHFKSADKKPHRLGCYHRNLTLLSLQTEALIQSVKPAGDALAKPAAWLLGRLYGGKATYKSASARAQIDADNQRAMIEQVRAHLKIPQPELRA